jgi:hypothetical protein
MGEGVVPRDRGEGDAFGEEARSGRRTDAGGRFTGA